MTVQAGWRTEISTFQEFCREAWVRPERVYLIGERPCHPAALTLASLAEERSTFWIKGPGWTARGIRKCAGERAIERIERKSRNARRSRLPSCSNIRFVREA